jgi:hypothetical protein
MFISFEEGEEENNDVIEIKKEVDLFLQDVLRICKEQETRIFDYKNIIRNYDKEANIEKEKMKKHFSDIKDDKERKLEKEIKKHHLGIFTIDQKVLQTYGKKRDIMLANMEPDNRDEDDINEEDEFQIITEDVEDEE